MSDSATLTLLVLLATASVLSALGGDSRGQASNSTSLLFTASTAVSFALRLPNIASPVLVA